MRDRLRRLFCRWLRAVPEEDATDEEALLGELWGDLWDARAMKTFWPRISRSDTWTKDLEPFFRQSLLQTASLLMRETDPANVIRLQERMKLLNEWLEAPVRAEQMIQIQLQQAARSPRASADANMAELREQVAAGARERVS